MVETPIEKKEVLKRHSQLINIRFPAITAFLAAPLILKIFFSVPFPNLLFLLVSFMALSTIVYDLFFQQIKEPKTSQIINGYFSYLLLDLVILTMIIYIIGGVVWIGFIFYGLYIYTNFLLFPRRYLLFFIFYSSFLYVVMVIIQYLGVFPSQSIFSLEERVPQNIPYILATSVAAITFLWVLGYYGDTFYKTLQGKIEELQKTRGVLEEERASLEIRVRARTNEFLEERANLEKKVKERTKELEKERKELTKRIGELERFHKVAVGRELRMRELKKEMEKIKKENKTEK